MALAGKVTLITGAARGIGKATADLFLKNAAKVCLVDIEPKELKETESQLASSHGRDNLISWPADVTDNATLSEAFKKTVGKFNGLDVVINNASILNESKMETMLSINMGGVVRGTELAIQHMDPTRGGVVLNIASMAGLYYTEGHRHLMPIYSASKAGVLAYTLCLAKSPDVLSRHIRLVCACPRGTDTALLNDPDPARCKDVQAYQDGARKAGVMSAEEVADIFMELIEDGTNHGKSAAIQGRGEFIYV